MRHSQGTDSPQKRKLPLKSKFVICQTTFFFFFLYSSTDRDLFIDKSCLKTEQFCLVTLPQLQNMFVFNETLMLLNFLKNVAMFIFKSNEIWRKIESNSISRLKQRRLGTWVDLLAILRYCRAEQDTGCFFF